MAQASQTRIEAHITGDVSGQVAVGQNILQIGEISGGVVYVAAPGERPEIRPRAAPVLLLPRPFPDLLDRHLEIAAADEGMEAGQVVEAFAVPGSGRTVLLRHLAHRPAAGRYPDGIVYLSARRRPLEDVHQALFDAFHERGAIPYRASESEVRHALAGRRALVLVDDLELDREEVQALVDAFPDLTLVLATPERRLWGESRPVAVEGLPADDALALIERTLGRALASEDIPAAGALTQAVGGRPLALVQAAARIAEGASVAELARLAAEPEGAQQVARERVAARPERQRRILALLAAIGGAALAAEEVGALSDVTEASEALRELADAALVETDGAGFSLADGLADAVGAALDLGASAQRAIAHLVASSGPPPVDAALALIERAAEARRFNDVVALARSVEPALVVDLRWGSWREVLETALEAARVVGDRAAEAWALHQLGTRAQCLGDLGSAEAFLGDAAELREALGDPDGAAASRGNLGRERGGAGAPEPPTPRPPAPRPPRPPRPPWVTVAMIVGGVVAVVVVATIAARGWIERWLDGQVTPPAARTVAVAVAPGRIDFGTTGLPAAVAPRTVRLSNPSTEAIAVDDLRLIGGDVFEIVEDGCRSTQLPPGETCTISVGFTPAEPGRFDGAVRIATTPAVPRGIEVSLAGRAALPVVVASPSPLVFDTVPADASAERAVEVRNQGPGEAAVDAVRLDAAPGLVIAGGSCGPGTTLRAGASCSVELTLAPREAGAVSGTLTIEGAFTERALRVPIEGAVAPAARAALALEPERIDFGAVEQGASSEARGIAVRNDGEAAARAVVVVEGADPGAFSLDNRCAGVLAPGAECVLELRFSPQAPRAHDAAVRVMLEGAPREGVVALAGEGIARETPPRAELAPPVLDFGRVAVGERSQPRTAALGNVGAGTIPVRRAYVDGPADADFRVVENGCSRRSLGPGQRCAVGVRFAPSAAGEREAVLVIEESGSGVEHRVRLAGIGDRGARLAAPVVVVEPNPVQLGSVPVGSRAEARLGVVSAGDGPLAVRSVSVVGAAARDFAVTDDDCAGRSIAPGGRCEIRLRFVPGAAGERLASLVLATNAARRETRVVLIGAGTPRATPGVPLPELPPLRTPERPSPVPLVPLPSLPDPGERVEVVPVPVEPTPDPGRVAEPAGTSEGPGLEILVPILQHVIESQRREPEPEPERERRREPVDPQRSPEEQADTPRSREERVDPNTITPRPSRGIVGGLEALQ